MICTEPDPQNPKHRDAAKRPRGSLQAICSLNFSVRHPPGGWSAQARPPPNHRTDTRPLTISNRRKKLFARQLSHSGLLFSEPPLTPWRARTTAASPAVSLRVLTSPLINAVRFGLRDGNILPEKDDAHATRTFPGSASCSPRPPPPRLRRTPAAQLLSWGLRQPRRAGRRAIRGERYDIPLMAFPAREHGQPLVDALPAPNGRSEIGFLARCSIVAGVPAAPSALPTFNQLVAASNDTIGEESARVRVFTGRGRLPDRPAIFLLQCLCAGGGTSRLAQTVRPAPEAGGRTIQPISESSGKPTSAWRNWGLHPTK